MKVDPWGIANRLNVRYERGTKEALKLWPEQLEKRIRGEAGWKGKVRGLCWDVLNWTSNQTCKWKWRLGS